MIASYTGRYNASHTDSFVLLLQYSIGEMNIMRKTFQVCGSSSFLDASCWLAPGIKGLQGELTRLSSLSRWLAGIFKRESGGKRKVKH